LKIASQENLVKCWRWKGDWNWYPGLVSISLPWFEWEGM